MRPLVLHSSATLAWILGGEATDALRKVFDTVAFEGALVPAIWRLDVANSLTIAIRKRTIHPDFRRATLADLALLNIKVDSQTDYHAWEDTLNLADHFNLAVYDAAYLELARRRMLPLATFDRGLLAAAADIDVTVVGEIINN